MKKPNSRSARSTDAKLAKNEAWAQGNSRWLGGAAVQGGALHIYKLVYNPNNYRHNPHKP